MADAMGARQERTIVLPNSKESGRNEMGRKKQDVETIISRDSDLDTGLNSAGRHGTEECHYFGQEETVNLRVK